MSAATLHIVFWWKGDPSDQQEIENAEKTRVQQPNQSVMEQVLLDQEKGQVRCENQLSCVHEHGSVQAPTVGKRRIEGKSVVNVVRFNHTPVSYTHLTLPTILLV